MAMPAPDRRLPTILFDLDVPRLNSIELILESARSADTSHTASPYG
jgi:hypothetical protein